MRMSTSWSPEHASKALQAISKSESAKCHTKELSLVMWNGTEVETASAAKKLLRLGHSFIDASQALARVEKLTLTLPASTAMALHGAFKVATVSDPDISLRNVKELVFSPFMHWIVDFCPNVKSIESNDWVMHGGMARTDLVELLIEAGGRASSLEHFALHYRWSMKLLGKIVKIMPQLKNLGLRGGCGDDMCLMLSLLRLMPKLHSLELMDAKSVQGMLHLRDAIFAFNPPIDWIQDGTQARRNVTTKVFLELNILRTLCLGGYYNAKLVSRDSAKIHVQWYIDASNTPADVRLQETSGDNVLESHYEMEVSDEFNCMFRKSQSAYEDDVDVEEEEELRHLQEEMRL